MSRSLPTIRTLLPPPRPISTTPEKLHSLFWRIYSTITLSLDFFYSYFRRVNRPPSHVVRRLRPSRFRDAVLVRADPTYHHSRSIPPHCHSRNTENMFTEKETLPFRSLPRFVS